MPKHNKVHKVHKTKLPWQIKGSLAAKEHMKKIRAMKR